MMRGQNIEIVSDSKIAVEWINGDNVGRVDHINLVYSIRDALRIHGSLKISFSLRASNSYANSLAKNGSREGGDLFHWGVA